MRESDSENLHECTEEKKLRPVRDGSVLNKEGIWRVVQTEIITKVVVVPCTCVTFGEGQHESLNSP